MDEAYCTTKKRNYTTTDFVALSEADLETLRYSLECPRCHQPAYYRKEARSGRQAACFGSRNHLGTCDLINATSNNHDEVNGENVDKGTKTIIIKLEPHDQEVVTHLEANNIPKATSPTTRGNSNSRGDHETSSTLLLNTLLKKLVKDENFQYSSEIIQFKDNIELPVHQFFVQLLGAQRIDEGGIRGYWGKISSGNYGAGDHIWLNVSYHDNNVLWIDKSIEKLVAKKYGFKNPSELENSYFLVLSELGANGRCHIKDLSHLAILRVD